MANPFTSVTVSNYNLNPPPDDGTEVPENKLQWAKHKEKIGDPLKCGKVLRPAGPGTVEVHHVKACKSGVAKSFRGLTRVVGVDLFAGEVALFQPDTFAVDHIDRGNYFDHKFRKFSRIVRPTGPDFSG